VFFLKKDLWVKRETMGFSSWVRGLSSRREAH